MVKDRQGRHLACRLFGAAAWKTKPRDQFIGWTDTIRTRRLSGVANNTRFLILPWVRVPHLASHLLTLILRRISADWQHKYGHPLHLIETFVERDRFRGTCYRAANWKRVGQREEQKLLAFGFPSEHLEKWPQQYQGILRQGRAVNPPLIPRPNVPLKAGP